MKGSESTVWLGVQEVTDGLELKPFRSFRPPPLLERGLKGDVLARACLHRTVSPCRAMSVWGGGARPKPKARSLKLQAVNPKPAIRSPKPEAHLLGTLCWSPFSRNFILKMIDSGEGHKTRRCRKAFRLFDSKGHLPRVVYHQVYNVY